MSSHSDTGTLYVLSNADHSLAKIGLTRNGTPICRADAYAREHGIRWHVYWYALTCNVAAAEARAHRELQDHRFSHVPGAREIFHITPEKAKRVAERHVIAPTGEAPQPNVGAVRGAWLEYGEVLWSTASLVFAYWLDLRRLHRRLRATFRPGRN